MATATHGKGVYIQTTHNQRPRTLLLHYLHTGDTVGEAVDIFQKDLAAIGLKADSAISLIMPESYIGLPFMNLDNESSEIHKKMQAHRILTQFIDSILDKQRGIFNITKGRWPRINSRLLGHAFVNWIIGDSKFRVDPDRCIHCGKCAKVCPTSDIECQNGETPVWKHNGKCLSCFACYHHCPTRAIEYGSRIKVRDNTITNTMNTMSTLSTMLNNK